MNTAQKEEEQGEGDNLSSIRFPARSELTLPQPTLRSIKETESTHAVPRHGRQERRTASSAAKRMAQW